MIASTAHEGAYAKINLTLAVGALRSDGFHEVRSVMQSISLCDDVCVAVGCANAGVELSLDCGAIGAVEIPIDGRNTAVRAAEAFCKRAGILAQGIAISVTKRITVQAGLAGGSADAAAVLRAMNRLHGGRFSSDELCEIAAEVGSDVPFCIAGGTAIATGRGEILAPAPTLPPCKIVVVKPEFSVSTPMLFRAIDDCDALENPDSDAMLAALESGELAPVAAALRNVFEAVLPPEQAATVAEIKGELLALGALGACMTGTGSVVFGLFEQGAEIAAATLEPFGRVWICNAI